MLKVDFHIHTVKTAVDSAFDFDIAKLKEYAEVMGLDGIAITNHNEFDLAQFRTIAHTLDITVLPGIEINLGKGKGHALLLADNDNLEDFAAKCQKISDLIKDHNDFIDVAKLREIYGDLSKYLIVPHYDKHPPVDAESLEQLGNDFIVGEVTSAKKFIYAQKNAKSKTPVLFSDARAKTDWNFKSRQTFLDVSSIDIQTMRRCLSDKTKLALSEKEGNELIQVTPDGVSISSGLTVLLGGRSSGKSHTLDQIAEYSDNVKYIKQFDLIEKAPEAAAKKFTDGVGKKQKDDGDRYLRQFRTVVDDVKNISLGADDRKVLDYVDTLLKAASETERHDAYSKSALYTESLFQTGNSDKLKKLIEAVEVLLNPGVYADTFDEHTESTKLKSLFVALVDRLRDEELTRKKREWVNTTVSNAKQALSSLSAVTRIKDVDLIEIAKNKKKIDKFEEIVHELQKPRTIEEKLMQRFTIREQSVRIKGAQELKDISGKVASFQDAFSKYGKPYEFLLELCKVEQVDPTAYYQFFTKIEYSILNEYGVEVSGGERAEFKLISEIEGAGTFDMLLIDEPESSFDNIFLSSDVNQTIKEIAKNMPVVIVTHNNTVGASIKPDYLIYTERTIVEKTPVYKVYSGRATDKYLTTVNGDSISNKEVTMRYLEAGEVEYIERKNIYEKLED